MNAIIAIDWREANRLHDQLDCMDVVLDDEYMAPEHQLNVLEAQVRGLRDMLPARFTPTRLNPSPGVEICDVCGGKTRGGHERDSSDHCDGHDEELPELDGVGFAADGTRR